MDYLEVIQWGMLILSIVGNYRSSQLIHSQAVIIHDYMKEQEENKTNIRLL